MSGRKVKNIKHHTTDEQHKELIISIRQKKNEKCVFTRWLSSSINKLCIELIIPNVETFKKPTKKLIKGFVLQEHPIGEYTNIELLEMLSRHEKKSVSDIIEKYIIAPKQLQNLTPSK